MTYDLIVIGGGPGGCATAITATRKGSRVLLLERGRYPRHRVCGEFVSAESLALLASLLSADQQELISAAPRVSWARVFADGSELRFEVSARPASPDTIWTSPCGIPLCALELTLGMAVLCSP